MWFFKKYGLLGQNERNLKFINEYNDDYAKKLADSKLKTKEFLQTKGINVSKTMFVVRDLNDLNTIDLDNFELPFVLKPNSGYGGKGILIVEKKDEQNNFITNDGGKYSKSDLIHHIKDILDGFYSLSGSRDKAIFEQKIILESSIELLGKYGLPDIRVIVFNMVPVMAMLRVPTENSKGKANLHGGACGVGVDIGTGKLTYITQFRKIIKSIPGIGDIRGIEIPFWDEVLKLALKVANSTNIGYLGCDIVLDDNVGPLLLEVNVRPGLEVQVANLHPLGERLKKVQNVKVNSVEKGVRLGKDLFGGDIEGKIKNISGKKVLGNREYIEVYSPAFLIDKSGIEIGLKSLCDIKTSKPNSYIDKKYLLESLKIDESKIKNDTIKLKCNILGEIRTIKFIVKDLERVNLILGKEALYGFLIDPFKYKENDLPFDQKNPLIKEKNTVILKSYETQLLRIDKELMDIDKKLNILKIITPKNIQSERLKFISSNGEYIPKLEYNDLNIDLVELFKKVSNIEIPEIPLSPIFLRKKLEIIDKIYFLEAFKNQNVKEMNKYNKNLFGGIKQENFDYAKKLIFSKGELNTENDFLTFEEIKDYVDKFNHIYSIDIELKEKEIVSRFQMSGNILYVKHGSQVGKNEIRAVIAHEIEGHYLRKFNGQKQKYTIFSRGGGYYLTLEEGIATYNQSKFLTEKDDKFYYNLERYYFMGYAVGNSYLKLIDEMKKYYNNDLDKVFRYLVRFKRGIKDISSDYVFFKDSVYLNGFLEVESYLKNGGSFKDLYFGKISLEDLETIKKSDFLEIKSDDLIIPLFN